MKNPVFKPLLLVSALCLGTATAQRQMESLGRGLVAVRASSTQVYVGWRLLGNDPSGIAFNLYRSANGGAAVKINASPLSATTDHLDTPANLSTTAYTYTVKPVVGGAEVADAWAHASSAPFALPVNPPTRQYIPVPLQPTPDDTPAASYRVKFCWVGDLDGDGEFDFVVDRHNPNEAARQWLQAYKRDGTLLWQINLGPNSVDQYHIEPGSSSISIGHGDNVTVYDMDGDGRSEVVLRTSNGVVLGDGNTISGGASENVQFLSIINGLTGAELSRATIPNPRLGDGPMNGHMGILYLDGKRPSVVWAAKNRDSAEDFHGVITAWDWRGGSLTQRWSWVDDGSIHAPEGHQIRIADVDNDGKDEFVDIGYTLDDNGTQLFNIPEIVHGDRFHLTDIDPDRPGLENYIIQQNNGTGLATALFDPGTGAMIRKWYTGSVVDVGRGLAADIDASSKGCEFFSTQPGIFNAKGTQIYSTQPFPPEAIWWDADLSRELVATVGSSAESPAISKFNPANPANLSRIYTIYNETAPGVYQAYGGRPQFWGDIFGDWREEYLCVANDNSEMRIYTPKTGSVTRLYTLMHNPQYRMQATTKGYVQANYVDYYLGTGMTPPQPPPMVDADLVWRGGGGSTTWDNGISGSWNQAGAIAPFSNGKSVLFDISADSSTTVTLSGALQPKALAFYSPKNQIIDGSSGSLSGPMTLMKAGKGSLTLSGNHGFTGASAIWDGALIVNGSIPSSALTVWGGTFGGIPAAGLSGGRLGGTGSFGQPVTLGYRAAVTPGSGMGNAGTLTFGGGLVAQDGSYFSLDLSNNPSSPTANDRVAIMGNLSLSGKVGLVIKALNGTLPPGTYTLVTYTGTLTGNVSNLDVRMPSGIPYTLAAGSGAITLTVPVTRASSNVKWAGGNNGNAWDLANSTNWTVAGSPGIFVAGDSVTFDAAGAANPNVNLTTSLPVAGVTVDSANDYQFSGGGSISGAGGVTKTGTGTLTLSTTNDYTGPTVVNGGTLAVDNLNDGGTASSIGAAGTAATNLVLNGGTLSLVGAQTNTNRSVTLGMAGGTLSIPSATSSLQISGALTGTGSLVKTGDGTLILAAPNNFTGGTFIRGGRVFLGSDAVNVAGLGSGLVTLDGGTLSMTNSVEGSSPNSTWPVNVPSGSSGRLNADGRSTLSGALTGGGDFTFHTPFIRTELTGNWSAFTGRIFVISDADGGDFRIRNVAGYPSAALDLGAGVYAYYNQTSGNLTIPIGALSGVSSSVLMGGLSSGGTITWLTGARNQDTTFAGVIANNTGPSALTKTGTGTLTLTGANTYTGPTNVSGGRLRINGSSTGTSYTVQNGGTLGGTGSITGNVNVQNGGALEHGGLGVAPLAISGNLTFAAGAVVRPVAGVTLQTGVYTLLTYSGTLTGTPSFTWEAPSGSTLVATFDTSVQGSITMTLDSAPRLPGLVTWTGSNSFSWDTVTANWTASGLPISYLTGDTVSFTDAGDATSAITLAANVQPAKVIVDAVKNHTFSGAGQITGGASLEKSGTGTLFLSAAHDYSGGSVIHGGTVVISNAGSLGTGAITLGGGTLAMGTLAPQNPIVVTGNSTISGGHSGGSHAVRDISGVGVLTLDATNVFDLEGDLSEFTGTLAFAGSGSFRFFNTAFSGSTAATFELGTRGLTARQGAAFDLGALSGLAGSYLGMAGNSNSAGCVYTIGGKNTDSTFAGVIANGSATKLVSIVKTGTGAFTLAGTNTYTGPTTIADGTLSVTGALAASSVTVAAGGRLGGTGSVGGSVTCLGTLAPGTSAGVLTLSSGLVLSTSAKLDFECGSTSDRADVSGNLTIDGTLNVTALAGFAAGSHTLFTYSGTLTDNGLTVGTLPAGYSATVSTATAGQVRLVVTQTVIPASITLGDLSVFYDGSAKPVSAATDPPGLSVSMTYDGGASVPFLPGSYAVSASISSPGYSGSATGTLLISPRTFDHWGAMNFTQQQILAGDAASGADPDGDGLTNLAEYALGGNPHTFTPQPVLVTAASSMSVTFQRPAWTGITYGAQAGPGLTGWEDLTLETISAGTDPETVRATFVFPDPKPAKTFLRLTFTP